MRDLEEQEQAERLFASLLGMDPGKRDAYLDAMCRDTPEVRRRVKDLLRDDERAGSFLKHPLLGPDLSDVDMNAPSGKSDPGRGSAHQFQPADIIANRFVVIRFINAGGMGEVYEVEDQQLRGVHVALKTILSCHALDPVMRARFKREVLMAREVVDPHVCPIYDIFEWNRPEGALVFLTMKLIEGETLKARLERLGKLPLPDVALIAHQVSSGLAAAHDAGILHRDIKPANIMLSARDGGIHPYVMDFGLARPFIAETTALTAGLAGTPGYVAPELYQGAAPSKAGDVYSMGVVLFQMFTGLPPAAGLPEALRSKRDGRYAAIPADWKNILERSLESDVTARIPDMREFLRSLPPITAETGEGSSRRWNLTRRKMITLGATSLVAASGGVWLGWDVILDLLEPLPRKRSVVLMAWPSRNANPVVSALLDSIRVRLSRAEAFVKDFVVLSLQDAPSESPVIDSPEKSVTVLGANLVLTASMLQDRSLTRLRLQLLDAVSKRLLRKGEVSYQSAEVSRAAEKAASLAATLLHLPEQEVSLNDPEELRGVPRDVFETFSEAEQMVRQPNRSGLQQAIVKYQRTLEMDQHFALGYARLAMAYIEQFLVTHEPANIGLADKNASLALQYNPNSAMGILARAVVLLYSGKTVDSLDSFDKALKADPTNPEILLYKAQALKNLEQLTAAAQVYRDIVRDRPNYWPAYNNLGEVLTRDAKYPEAAKAFASAAMAAPKVALPMANLGATYLQMGRKEDAKAALIESLRRAPNSDSYLALGDIDFEDKKYEDARRNYEKAGELEPNYHLVQRNIGDCYAMLGNTQKVRESYSRAAALLSASLETNPKNGNDWATLAFYHAKIGDAAHAESDLKTAKSLGTNDVNSRFLETQALVLMGKTEEALKLLFWCMDQGVSAADVDLALDLKILKKDSRYRARVRKQAPAA